jgi:hypothetical protein
VGPALTKDKLGHFHMRHRLSKVSGTYRGRKVIDLTAKLDKKAKKSK